MHEYYIICLVAHMQGQVPHCTWNDYLFTYGIIWFKREGEWLWWRLCTASHSLNPIWKYITLKELGYYPIPDALETKYFKETTFNLSYRHTAWSILL